MCSFTHTYFDFVNFYFCCCCCFYIFYLNFFKLTCFLVSTHWVKESKINYYYYYYYYCSVIIIIIIIIIINLLPVTTGNNYWMLVLPSLLLQNSNFVPFALKRQDKEAKLSIQLAVLPIKWQNIALMRVSWLTRVTRQFLPFQHLQWSFLFPLTISHNDIFEQAVKASLGSGLDRKRRRRAACLLLSSGRERRMGKGLGMYI